MSVEARSEPIAAPPDAHARTRAGTPLHAQPVAPAEVRAKAHCASCGEAWFGDVAYCPYCGRPSAGAPVAAAPDPGTVDGLEPELVPFVSTIPEQPDPGRKRWAKPLAVAAVLAVLTIAVGQFALRPRDKPPSQAAVRGPVGEPARTGTIEMGAGVPAPAPSVPRAGPQSPAQPRAAAPPARNRSLCSAANEAAGLCNPQ